MCIKDYFEILYWLVSVIILGFTVYWIKISPIKAVQTGRKLDNEQNKYNTKRDLFLTLFSLRGKPTHYNFVNGLNQIDIVFEDNQMVLQAWEKLYESLRNPNQNDALQNWELLRVDLLSSMAECLGYSKLKQTTIQRSYFPEAHVVQNDENQTFQNTAKTFFEEAIRVSKIWIERNSNNKD